MKYFLLLILMIGTFPATLQAVEGINFLWVKLDDDKLTFGDGGINYRGPTEIGFWGIGWYERFENTKDGKYFVMDDRGRIGDRKKTTLPSIPTALSRSL